ncbi:MAG: DUF1850 domain-containing protein [Anaerolineae bacterium]
MQWRRPLFALLAAVLVVGGLSCLPHPGYTRVDLVDLSTGRSLLSAVLHNGEKATLTWTNSIFGLPVVEVFAAEAGSLVLQEVTFEDVRGVPPPMVTSADVEDLYHTGGAFTAREIRRPLRYVIFRIGEIGNPRLRVRSQEVDFQREVGFGGRIAWTAREARLYEVLLPLRVVWSRLGG